MHNKLLIIFIISLISITSSGQEKMKPLKVYNHKDEVSKKEFYMPSRRLKYTENNTSTGSCEAYLLLANKKDKVVSNTFHAICTNLGCVEESTLIVLFENDEKIERKSLNTYNCNGETHFPLSKKDLELLAKIKVKQIIVKNEREFKTVIGDIKENDYFINLLTLVKENKIEEKR